MEIVIMFGACAALLKKSIENGHFRAFSPWNFQKVDRYGKTDSPYFNSQYQQEGPIGGPVFPIITMIQCPATGTKILTVCK